MQMIESMIPDSVRDFSNAVARLEVAFKDAKIDEELDLDKAAAEVILNFGFFRFIHQESAFSKPFLFFGSFQYSSITKRR